MQTPLIEVRNLRKEFEDGYEKIIALDDLNFEIYQGEIVCFFGASGCGKTTLMKCISGVKDCEGSILIDGCSSRLLHETKQMGIAFQDYSLIEWMTALENVRLPFEIGLIKISKKEATHRATAMLKEVGLADRLHFLPAHLSGGMKQRVSFARALCHQPKLTLLDEPFSALDHNKRKELIVLFEKILRAQSMTSIIITHDIEEAVYLSNRIFFMTGLPGKITGQFETRYNGPRGEEAFRNSLFFERVREAEKIMKHQ